MNQIFTKLLKFIDQALLKATKEESILFAETQNIKMIEHENTQHLVVGEHLEEVYGNHKTPKDQYINLDLLRQNIMNHFERVYTNGITHIMGTSKSNCRKITK
ncbi:MAG: hypothetical protein Q8S31_09475 [Alphaproteobacteria bacterium]|nr:hypothetical protein [Alphaproteobacteria bacterium]